MKLTFAALAIASVSAECACLTEADGLPPASFFEEMGYAGNFGNGCGTHTKDQDYCLEGGENFGEDWCDAQGCYVVAENTCVDSETTEFFADTEYSTIEWSVAVCSAETEEKANMGLYTSMAALAAVVAAAI